MRIDDLKRRFLEGRLLPIVFLLVLSYFSIVHNFWSPPYLFWDENYHIASAQKYLNGIYFMEPHPPLGKLFIALGEYLFHPNALATQFLNTDYGSNLPAGFSFFGYRFFPVMLAWATVPVIYLIFRRITGRNLWAVLLSFLYVFDNALLVHLRSAMLESTLLFFCSLTILGFLLAIDWMDDPKRLRWAAILTGSAFGLALATKLFALVLILLVPALLWMTWPRVAAFFRFLGVALLAGVLCYCAVWYVHFSIGTTVNPKLPDQGFYQASERYQEILKQGKGDSIFAFPIALQDHLAFVDHYEDGVPRLDMCKTDENGSPWFYWPFGARSINYRWESDTNGTRYLFLQANPVVWAAGLLGVLLSLVLLLGSQLSPEPSRLRSGRLLAVFMGIYVSYMIAVSGITRVMYLYHYFVPLLLTFFLFALCFMELTRIGRWKLTEERKGGLLVLLAFLIFAGYQVYRPFTYYEPIGDDAVQRRNLLRVWELRCVNCSRDNPVAVPQNPVP